MGVFLYKRKFSYIIHPPETGKILRRIRYSERSRRFLWTKAGYVTKTVIDGRQFHGAGLIASVSAALQIGPFSVSMVLSQSLLARRFTDRGGASSLFFAR
jgi:hypothetical protein